MSEDNEARGISIVHYPDRKRPALAVVDGGIYRVVGYLKDKESEKMLSDRLKDMFGLDGDKDDN
jgi:hypothetical protein